MKRRDFFMAAGATAAFPAFGFASAQSERANDPGDFIELIKYRLMPGTKKNQVRDFYKNAAIPALNKMGISPIGVFTPMFGTNDPTLYIMIPHKNIESFLTLPARMLANEDLMKAGTDFMNTTISDPAYIRM